MPEARFCTLSTIGDRGEPQARVVDPLQPDGALVVYIATNPRSRKVAEIRKDPRVTLLYFDPVRSAYVTLIGVASEVPTAEKAAHRKKDWEAFFPASKPETYSLYRIVPSRLELVSAKDGFSGDPATWRPEIIKLK
jgi:general stress protein 26